MKNAEIIAKLNLEQKCALLSGAGTFTTRGCPKAGVPSITLSDGPNGVRKQAGAADHLGLNPSVPATCFPTAATVACSWDPALGEQLGQAMGEEAAAQEVAVLLGPGLNTKRSPLCGRNFEYFSEDPYLSGKMAAAYVRGIQSEGIAACPKHFAVNSQELRRMASDSVLDERTLRELYLTGFEIVVKEAAPKTIMSSYNLVNGTYANENAHLLQDILRRDWGFSGAVVTDWGGSNDHALGVKNGSTLEMPAPGGDAVRELLAAVQSGKITEADVDARLDELLTLVLDTSAAVQKHSRSFDADAHHALARRAAADGHGVPGDEAAQGKGGLAERFLDLFRGVAVAREPVLRLGEMFAQPVHGVGEGRAARRYAFVERQPFGEAGIEQPRERQNDDDEAEKNGEERGEVGGKAEPVPQTDVDGREQHGDDHGPEQHVEEGQKQPSEQHGRSREKKEKRPRLETLPVVVHEKLLRPRGRQFFSSRSSRSRSMRTRNAPSLRSMRTMPGAAFFMGWMYFAREY